MTSKLLALAFAAVPTILAACSGPPKQAEAPDVEKETGSEDMAPAPGEGGGSEQAATAAPEQGEMREKCCAECKAGMAKDRSGSSPDSVPCADFTDTLSPWCLEHFRSQPVMASKCQ